MVTDEHVAIAQANLARSIDETLAEVGRAIHLAEAARTAAEKVQRLLVAKATVEVISGLVAVMPDSFTPPADLDRLRDQIERLELTFRAFGFYRMAGVSL